MNVYVALSLNFINTIIRKIRVAYYMSRGQRHKSAISITLDDKVLAFFSGKGRSGKINEVLTQYLLWNLGRQTTIGFDETTDRTRISAARNAIQTRYGNESIQFQMITWLYEGWDDE